MLHNIFKSVSTIRLTPWVLAYIGIITLYTLIPQSLPFARDGLSLLAKLMLAILILAIISRTADEL